jgi:hypothetical protein
MVNKELKTANYTLYAIIGGVVITYIALIIALPTFFFWI